jgi:hypothetical protein
MSFELDIYDSLTFWVHYAGESTGIKVMSSSERSKWAKFFDSK